MNSFITEIKRIIKPYYHKIKGKVLYNNDKKAYIRQSAERNNDIFVFDKSCEKPCITDRFDQAGGYLDGHYFPQDIYMANKVINSGCVQHYDIGSRINGFIAHLLSSPTIENVIMLDIRPLDVTVDKLSFLQADATNLDNIEDDSIQSISSLHAIEHFGLGRYGDEVDIDGWKKALCAIQKKICRGGYFYFSVPIGPVDKLCFNSHRVFNPLTIINTLPGLMLTSFAYIHDFNIIDVDTDNLADEIKNVSEYDCGLFIFQKI